MWITLDTKNVHVSDVIFMYLGYKIHEQDLKVTSETRGRWERYESDKWDKGIGWDSTVAREMRKIDTWLLLDITS